MPKKKTTTKPKTTKPKETKESSMASLEKMYVDSSKKYSVNVDVEWLSTGDGFLDDFLCGGIPRGKVIVLSAPSGTGKSTMVLWICQHLCSQGHWVLYLDPEHAVTDVMLEGTGVKPYYGKNFIYYRNRTYTSLDELMVMYTKGGSVKPPALVVIDSAPSIVSDKVEEDTSNSGEGSTGIGYQARPMGAFLTRWKGKISDSNVGFIMINQARKAIKVNMYEKLSYKEEIFGGLKPWGGEALNFFADIRLWLDPGTLVTDPTTGAPLSRFSTLHCTKTKVGKMGSMDVNVIFCCGIDTSPAMLQVIVNRGLATLSKGWYEVDGSLLGGQSKKFRKEDLISWAIDNQEMVIQHIRNMGDGGGAGEAQDQG